MTLRRRKVISSILIEEPPRRGSLPLRILELECGHSISRRDKRPGGPQSTAACDQCEIALDRLALVDPPGWTLSTAIKVPHSVLRLLEREGLVESNHGPRGEAIYWRLRRL